MNISFWYERICLFVSIFPFFIPLRKWKKLSQVTLTFFLRFFSSACKLKNQVGTAYLGVYCPSFCLNHT